MDPRMDGTSKVKDSHSYRQHLLTIIKQLNRKFLIINMENDLVYRRYSFLLLKGSGGGEPEWKSMTIMIDFQRIMVNSSFKGLKMIPPGTHLVQFSTTPIEICSHLIFFKERQRATFTYCKEGEEVLFTSMENIADGDGDGEDCYAFLERMDKFLYPHPTSGEFLKWQHLLNPLMAIKIILSFSPVDETLPFSTILERKDYLKTLKGADQINKEAIEDDYSFQLKYEFPSKEQICQRLHLAWIAGQLGFCWEALREWMRIIILMSASRSFLIREVGIANLFIALIEDHLSYRGGCGGEEVESMMDLPLKDRLKVCVGLKKMHNLLDIAFRMKRDLMRRFFLDEIPSDMDDDEEDKVVVVEEEEF